jgi:hypothetical protein
MSSRFQTIRTPKPQCQVFPLTLSLTSWIPPLIGGAFFQNIVDLVSSAEQVPYTRVQNERWY